MNDLKPDERIEDLQYGGLKIIQSASEYRFTTDAVLLANFVKGAKGKMVVELGAGCGVIGNTACHVRPFGTQRKAQRT